MGKIGGVSSLNKTDETETPNQIKPNRVVRFKTDQTNLNRSCLVRFSVSHFEI